MWILMWGGDQMMNMEDDRPTDVAVEGHFELELKHVPPGS
ncbi:hypothetical protein PC116_g26478 [Phytophthora cactorum]|nr:hypothetical protein Pcac1_g9407 [Phytophthora cactorum]KAG4225079.1 hypothetical protein PC116_g26478 [Phytophthora cactorum]